MPTKTRINGQNYTQLPRLVSDDIILKGLPQTAGAPDGFGDLADVVIDLVNSCQIVSLSNFVLPTSDFNDLTTEINAAAEFANINGLSLLIPEGDFRFKGTISIKSNLICVGRLIASGSGADKPRIFIENKLSPTALNVSALTGLNRGLDRIPALSSSVGKVVTFISTEVAIDRQGTTDKYFKEESFLVTDSGGSIYPPLMHSYTSAATITATETVFQSPTFVKGLNVFVEYAGVDNDIITASRSNVVIEDLKLIAAASEAGRSFQGVHILNACAVTMVRPEVYGFLHTNGVTSRLGYGINARRSSQVRVYDQNTGNNKHSFDALNSKDIRLIGGYSRSITPGGFYPVGVHYASDLTVEGMTIITTRESAVGFAGGDVIVRNCRINTGSVVGIRSDSPEIYGDVIVDSNEIDFLSNVADETYFFGLGSISLNYTGVFSRKLLSPTIVRIENNTYRMIVGGSITRTPTSVYNRDAYGLIYQNNMPIGSHSPAFLNSFDGTRSSMQVCSYITSASDVSIQILNNGSRNNLTLRITRESDDVSTWKYNVVIENSGTIDYRFDVDSLRNHSQIGGSIFQARTLTVLAGGATVRTPSFFFNFSGVTFVSGFVLWRPANKMIAIGCSFLSTVGLTTDANNVQNVSTTRINAFVFCYHNRAPAGTDPAQLPTLNNYFDNTVFLVN